MLLLEKLPPPTLPKPISFELWKENAAQQSSPIECEECNNTGLIDCDNCSGSGEHECCECGHEKDCEECNGTGNHQCECINDPRGINFTAYVDAIATDYQNLLFRKQLVMPWQEIKTIARNAARH